MFFKYRNIENTLKNCNFFNIEKKDFENYIKTLKIYEF